MDLNYKNELKQLGKKELEDCIEALNDNIEYAKANLDDENYIVRWGPGIQYLPAQRIELRGDIYNTRVFGPEASAPDSWTLLLQTHLWL